MHPADPRYRPFPDFAAWMESRVAHDLWDRSIQLLSEGRAAAGEGAFARLAERATRMAAIDTGAIEGLYEVDRGFTVTVASMASGWEAEILRDKGPDVTAHVAAQRQAYEMALDAATSSVEVSEAWIRRLHEVICAPQDTYAVRTALGPQLQPLPKGSYKTQANHVEFADGSVHAYAPVGDTPAEMHRLVTELRSPTFQGAHPVLQASYAHYAFVCIHPFADGNGRVARVLTSIYTLRATSLPFVVFADQKDGYLTALKAADGSAVQAFVDFVLQRSVELQQLVTEQLRETTGGSLEQAARRLSDLSTYPEVGLLREQVGVVIESQVTALALPKTVIWDVVLTNKPEEFGPQDDLGIRLFFRTYSPRIVSVEDFVTIKPHRGVEGDLSAFVVQRLRRPDDTLTVRRNEVSPAVTAVLEMRIHAWARRVLRELLEELTDKAERW